MRIPALFVLLFAVAPASHASVMEDVVATVNGRPILLSDYRKNLDSLLEGYRRSAAAAPLDGDAVKEIRRQVLDKMVEEEVLIQEADKLKLRIYDRDIDKSIEEIQENKFRVDPNGKRRSDAEMSAAVAEELKAEGLSERQFRERIRKQLLVRKVLENQVRSKLQEPEDGRMKRVFDKLKYAVDQGTAALKGMGDDEASAYADFAARLRNDVSERVRASHILVKVGPDAAAADKEKALKRVRALKKRLDNGEDFYELAKKESDDAESAARGGDLGFILRGWMPPEFDKAAFSIGVGQVSDPVETSFGYHLIRVSEKKAKQPLNYDQLKPYVKQFVYQLDFQKEEQVLVHKLLAKAVVEKNPPAQ